MLVRKVIHPSTIPTSGSLASEFAWDLSLEFQALFDWGYAGRGKSFPSGHATVGFLPFGMWFVLRFSQPVLAQVFLWSGLFGGLCIGWMRVAAGAHFASDVLWAGLSNGDVKVKPFSTAAKAKWLYPATDLLPSTTLFPGPQS